MPIRPFLLAALLAGCVTPGVGVPTTGEWELASEICFDRSRLDRARGSEEVTARWFDCTTQHFMPLEIRFDPRREREIMEIYEKLAPLSKEVDVGAMTLSKFLEAWDRLNQAADLPYCMLRGSEIEGGICMQYWRPADRAQRHFRRDYSGR